MGDERSVTRAANRLAETPLWSVDGSARTGKYVGAKGQATIDPSLGLQDYQIVLG